MGGRGGGGTGGGKGGGKGSDSDVTVDKRPAVDAAAEKHSDPNAAAESLGLTGADKDHFVNGANSTERKLDDAGSPEAAAAKFKAAVIAYERKYGRGAAQVYSRGGYWSLVRFIKTVMAVSSTVTQAGSAPALAAVNAAMLTAYWVDRAKR
ncbi:hypothetical protein PBI_TOURACH_138 [Mycobacterium phage Tourach]|uniref:Uncharacterized protein n=1 Tax=Mycobacterium phage Tourach TaxID=2599882 RepID=A0A5J6TU79_9CAUD|nr:hypothetical protein J4T98_gp112 [Mycobacterium phage Tourach]QFG14360.1 hypothetical protein PBI_TOURACH_138 [Mycobacterium phage Tourach]